MAPEHLQEDTAFIEDLFYRRVQEMTLHKEAWLDLQFSDRWF